MDFLVQLIMWYLFLFDRSLKPKLFAFTSKTFNVTLQQFIANIFPSSNFVGIYLTFQTLFLSSIFSGVSFHLSQDIN